MIAQQRVRIADTAAGLIDAPFRLHGRDPANGIDCVGLVLLALRGAGIPAAEPPPYQMRQVEFAVPADIIRQAGLASVSSTPQAGDILLTCPGPAQLHLLVQGHDGRAIHADAALGRIVATPSPLLWPLRCQWRLFDKG